MDDEVLQKRFTDCVYFLASPLTCKKGIECEYRHSEIARLNPEIVGIGWEGAVSIPSVLSDILSHHLVSVLVTLLHYGCQYPSMYFDGSLPLEGLKEAHGESSDHKNGPALLVNKTNIPCYFYSNGYCIKGDRCSFLHGPADDSVAFKSSKAASTVNNGVPCEKKLSSGSNTGMAPVRSHPDPSKTAQVEQTQTESKPPLDSPQLASGSAERSESLDISATQCQENVVRSDSLLPRDAFVQSESDVYDQTSDQQVEGYVEREGWLESSPGFDVLVEGESERLGYEGDADYFSVHDEEGRELDVRYAECGFRDPDKYDPAYPELGIPLREEKYDVYNRLDNKRACDYVGKISGQSRESIFYRLSFQKRNSQTEPIFNGRRGPDLREHLKKCKVDDRLQSCFSKGYDPPRLVDHRVGRYPRRHGSRGGFDFDHRGNRLRKVASVNRFKQPVKDKRPGKPQFLSSEVSRARKPTLRQKIKSRVEAAVFTGPKTLDQIKEEKKKTLQNIETTESDGFLGPRPLNEILKNKRKLG
ncbi:hypothetical protein OSB04_015139 [Centaurea solstitialis]|uniref:C3H1-type domain-containing protein n=1 Tax=Centaurea solstitialis TaxID=347529 RepID=A0AA38T016_9ASTR|nr:hypothetical protein OSB04_015139 [Centaurea solstitialis]